MNPPSTLSRTLAPLAGIFWALFIVTSVLVAVVWATGFGDATAAEPWFKRTFPNRELRSSLVILSRAIDPAWIALGAAAVYLAIARSEGLALARRWALLTMFAGFLVSLLSVKTRWPLGPVFFPENFGWKIVAVPFGIPLLWFVIVTGSREVIMRFRPRASHVAVAVGAALLSVATFAILDPLAWKYRAWWLWYPKPFEGPNHAPVQSYLTWFVVSLVLAWLMRSVRIAPPGEKRPTAPVIVWAVLNGIVIATYIALGVR